jgi:lysophospholipase L1-like esterase
LSGVPNVLLINIRANRPWTAQNNALLAAKDNPGDNLILVDWNSLANNCAGNCFASDGIHLSADGQKFYADMIGDITGR